MADTFIIPDVGKVAAMRVFTGLDSFPGFIVTLLKATPMPADHTLVRSDLVVADYAGYAPQTGVGWSAPSLSTDFRAMITATAMAFIPAAGSQTIYGVAMYTDQAGAPVVAVRVFDTPFVITPATPLVFTPEIFIGPPG